MHTFIFHMVVDDNVVESPEKGKKGFKQSRQNTVNFKLSMILHM